MANNIETADHPRTIPIPPDRWRLLAGKRIYFVGPEGGLVKIGRTSNLRQRMTALQIASSERLHVWAVTKVEPLYAAFEALYHARFASARRHGEWFERCPEIEAEISRLEYRCMSEVAHADPA